MQKRYDLRRLYVLPAGPRLIAQYLASIYNQITQASSILNCGAAQFLDRISQVVDERKSAEKRVSDLESELVWIVAKGFLYPTTRANEEKISAHVHRNDDPLVFLTGSTTAKWYLADLLCVVLRARGIRL
jgi:misacylated tRNA(Ala) deacylase